MNLYKQFFFILLFIKITFCNGQNTLSKTSDSAVLKLERDTVDYGTIPYYSESTRILKITNTGKAPLIIYNCQGSDPVFATIPRDPINPGKTAEIKIHTDTRRVGSFLKTQCISSNASAHPKCFLVKGKVLPEDTMTGVITFDHKEYSFGTVYYNTTPSLSIPFTNTGKKSLIINAKKSFLKFEITFPKDSIKPGERGEIIVKDTIKRSGGFNESIKFSTNGSYYPYAELYISGFNMPDPNRPILEIGNKKINLGKIPYTNDGWHHTSFEYKNIGKKPLLITNMYNMNSSGGDPIRPNYPNEPLKSGHQAKMEFDFCTYDYVGWFFKDYCIATNGFNHMCDGTNFNLIGYVLPDSNEAVVSFEQDTIDLGRIQSGKIYTLDLKFKNTGKKPLELNHVNKSDEVIPIDWPKYPILPGQTASITVNVHNISDASSNCFSVQSNAVPSRKFVWVKWGGTNYGSDITNAKTLPPLKFDTSITIEKKEKATVAVFILDCTNTSSDTIEIYNTNIENSFDPIGIPFKQAYDFSQKKIILPNQKTKIVFMNQPSSSEVPKKIQINIVSHIKDNREKYFLNKIFARVKVRK